MGKRMGREGLDSKKLKVLRFEDFENKIPPPPTKMPVWITLWLILKFLKFESTEDLSSFSEKEYKVARNMAMKFFTWLIENP